MISGFVNKIKTLLKHTTDRFRSVQQREGIHFNYKLPFTKHELGENPDLLGRWFRRRNMRIGGGTRVKPSGTNRCNPADLTVQPRYRKVDFSSIKEAI